MSQIRSKAESSSGFLLSNWRTSVHLTASRDLRLDITGVQQCLRMTMITMILQVFGTFAVIERESMMSGTRAASALQLLADLKASNFHDVFI
jgi:hypothetical protein